MGSVVISLDAELGWGFHDLDRPPEARVERARRGWRRCRSLFEAYDVPATWAVVGHLLLAECDGDHADHPVGRDWFERERTTWRDRPDLRFAPDLVRQLLDSPVDHEFACHTFSHVVFDDPRVTPEVVRAELERSIELADEWGLSIDSLVFPRNEEGYRRQLADAGFSTYRSWTPVPEGPRGVFETVVRGRSQLVEPRIDEFGLVDLPASMFAFGLEGAARRIAESVWADPMVVRARRGIDEAVADDGVFHLWFHPNNLLTEREDERIRAILAHVDRRRTETDLRVETMAEVADRTLAAPERRAVARPTERA